MKKDKEWLKEEVYKLIEGYISFGGYEHTFIAGENVNKLVVLIDQLDEPEVNQLDKKIRELESYNDELIRDNNQLRSTLDNQEVLSQEWIDEHKYNHYIGKPFVYVDDLQKLIVQKQEKPVIPQFVADWIESYRKKTLVELINDAVYSSDEDSKCFRRWFHEKMGFESNYSEFISRAWLDGYEVEKEKRYYIIDKTNNSTLMTFELSDVVGWEVIEFVYGYSENETIHFNSKEKAELIAHFVGESLEVEEVTE